MKKSFLLIAAMFLVGFAAQAQNYMVVNTEKVFMAMPAYVQAIESVEKLSESYQKQVDDRYAEIEKMYNAYQTQKATLNEATRKVREDAIIGKEQEVLKYQEEIFGQEGTIMKKRVELIKPIQDKVFAAITKYAQSNKYELVLDIAANPTVLYYAPAADKTEEIIKLTK